MLDLHLDMSLEKMLEQERRPTPDALSVDSPLL